MHNNLTRRVVPALYLGASAIDYFLTACLGLLAQEQTMALRPR